MYSQEEQPVIGTSTCFQDVLRKAQIVAAADCAVLIQGETGTGKEVIAQLIHNHSPRNSGPLVKVNCAAIPPDLLESELFGHDRGAFTGAWTRNTGRFQLAHGGTLFLDEIGDLPVQLQPKLLRATEEHEFERLGNPQTVRVDARIIAASNRDLDRMVEEGRFRTDLFYRLNVFPITLPPLRDRKEDIPLLVMHFVRKFAQRMNKSVDEVSAEIMEVLLGYDWPGNIRELQNFVERAVLMTEGSSLHAPLSELRPLTCRKGPPAVRTLADVERAYMLDALHKANWTIGGRRGAAARVGLPRTTFISRMRKYGICRERVRLPAIPQITWPSASSDQYSPALAGSD